MSVQEQYLGFDDEAWLQLWRDHADGLDLSGILPSFPPDEVQRLTNNLAGRKTIDAAWPLYLHIRSRLAFMDSADDPKILDVGAGWGRFLRLLLRDSSSLFATDVDEVLVDTGRSTLPDVDWRLMVAGKPLPYETGSFDLVFANSVLSHLSEELHLHTIREVARVLRPGGEFIGTTLTASHVRQYQRSAETKTWASSVLGDLDDVVKDVESGSFRYGATGRWTDYGLAVVPLEWTANRWAPDLEVVDVLEDSYSQVINLARKQ